VAFDILSNGHVAGRSGLKIDVLVPGKISAEVSDRHYGSPRVSNAELIGLSG
jgi:hypothetical protein